MTKEIKKMLVPSDIPKFLQPGKRILLPGKIMLKPYGKMIWDKTQKAIVVADKFAKYVDIPIYLIEEDKALGIIRLKPAKEIGVEEFAKLEEFHKVSKEERESWWPIEQVFYYYEVEMISKFEPFKKIIKEDGSYSWIDSVVFKGLDIGDPTEFKNEDLMRGHKLIHSFWKKLEATDADCIKYHVLFRNEILNRKLKHKEIDTLDKRSKEIEAELKEKGYEISFDREKSLAKIQKSEIISKPYPAAHSCRLQIPGKYDRFARKNCAAKSDGKCIDFVYGIKDGKSELQGMRYPKDVWNASSAGNHCKSKGGRFEAASKKTKKDIKMADEKENIRWNLNLSEAFDVAGVESTPASFEYEMFSKFLNCDIKNVYQNSYQIPSPLLGTCLSGFKKVLSEFELCDCRNFTYSGKEVPLVYEVIKLNSEKSDDFLIDGTSFYKVNGENKLVVQFRPTMTGMEVSLSSTNEEKVWNKELLKRVQKWVKENNFLRGEIFGLSGDFLKKTSDTYDDLFLDKEILDCVTKSVKQLNDNRENAPSRGLMFIGKPGTGKTKTGKILMNTLEDVTFIWVSSRDFHKVGSNTALKIGFDLARDLAPSVLFMEDIDTWLGGSSMDLLKTEMDGLKTNKGVITILTSNNPEEFPDALLDRPGRFHDVLDFSLPIKEMRKKMIVKWVGEEIEDSLMESILDNTDGYSGAHIKELVDFAKMIKMDDKLDIGQSLVKSLKKLQKQKELINRIKSENAKKRRLMYPNEKSEDFMGDEAEY